MGDMADYINSQENFGEDADGWDEGEEDGLNAPPLFGCSYCGACGFLWGEVGKVGWRLLDAKSGEIHSCKEYTEAKFKSEVARRAKHQ